MYLHRTSLGPVDLAFTDRYGGVSGVPYDELNLAVEGGDDPDVRAENHRILLADFAPGDVLADLHQVHGADVVVATAAGFAVRPDADGVVATEPGVTLMVRAADCVPVVLADPGNGVIGVAHAGRLGMERGVVPATVARMRARGATAIKAWIGPHICGRCYEVPQAMRDAVGGSVPEAVGTTSWGTPALDLGAGVRAQLERDGVEVTALEVCTLETPSLYSYRRDGVGAGRLAGVVRVRR
ncbi:YfiH family protein [Marmoricola sp. OAE513]|uniref:polyphenol oxidase family protein n=1 Tax=Marmoricola sp. OAE513 TaxID=2817894 RepID=UPI001AE59822